MEIVLTGRNFSAKEAEQWGLVSRIVGDSHQGTVDEAIKVAEKITSKGRVSVQAAKEAVNACECGSRRRSWPMLLFGLAYR